MTPPRPKVDLPPATEERGIPFAWYDLPIAFGVPIIGALVLKVLGCV